MAQPQRLCKGPRPPDSVACDSVEQYELAPLVQSFLRHEYSKIDDKLPSLLLVLDEVRAGECWHKKSTFKEHLFQVYKILKIWGQDAVLANCGLLHSAYSNSYVNLAIFDGKTDRNRVASLVGQETEALIHLFCVVPRHQLIYEELLYKLPDDAMKVPAGGVTVNNIKTGEPLLIDVQTVGRFLILTMADFAEQLYSWQDSLFENVDARLEFRGHQASWLWPGEMKPGLWMSAVSRMGLLLRSCLLQPGGEGLVLPPVFNQCSVLLPDDDQLRARDLYWDAATTKGSAADHERALGLLQDAISLNPFIAEPHVIIAQILMQRQQYQDAMKHANEALRLFAEWGTAWDKRMSWDAWVAFTRVILENASSQTWPTQPFGMLNLGLVR